MDKVVSLAQLQHHPTPTSGANALQYGIAWLRRKTWPWEGLPSSGVGEEWLLTEHLETSMAVPG